MNAHSLAGLAVLNLLFLGSGLGLLWLVRGWGTWLELARLAGLAYVVGVVSVGSIWTIWLIVGAPFSLAVVLLTPIAVALVCVVAARRLGRERPRRARIPTGKGVLVTAVGIGAAGLLLEGFFRGARLSGLYWWDAWSFWVPKGKTIYLLGGLDEQLFTELPGPSYPPLIPVLDAAAFHLMGSADVVTLHVQYWLLGVGCIWAIAGLLSERVPAWMLWPFVVLLLVAPRIGRRLHITEADLFLQFTFVLAAVLVLYWLHERERWRLVTAAVLLGGVVLTKREGLLLVAVLLAATALVSVRDWRSVWPALGAAACAVAVVAAPWRIWYLAHGVAAEGPTGGGVDPTASTDRLWPSIRLAFDVLFSSEYWSVLVPVAVGALLLAALTRQFVPAVYFGVLVALVTLGGAWFTWAIHELPITQDLGGNPIVRYMGAAALLCAVASPLLLAAVWSAVASGRRPRVA